MKMKLSSTSLLLFLLLGLGSWYFIYEKTIRVEKKKNEEISSKLISYNPEEIQELEIIYPDSPAIFLKRAGDKWLITSPVEDEADSSSITSLVTSLTNAKEERIIEEAPSQLEPFGLDKPQLTLKISKDAASQEVLKFGSQTQVGFGVYIQSASKSKIIKTSKALLTAFQKSLFELRNMHLVHLTSPQIKEVELQGTHGRFLVNRSEEGKWFIQGSPVNETRWNRFLSSLTQLKAKTIAAEKETNKSFGLEKPLLKIWISEGSDKPKKAIWFSQIRGQYFAKSDDKPIVYELDKSALEPLHLSSSELKDDHILSLNRFSVSRILITKADSKLELTKEGTLWRFSDLKPDEKVDPGKVESYLTQLQDLTGKVMDEGQPAVPVKPQLTVEVFENKNNQFSVAGKIELEKPINRFSKGKSSYLPLSWRIPSSSFQSLDKNRSDFLETPKDKKTEEKILEKERG